MKRYVLALGLLLLPRGAICEEYRWHIGTDCGDDDCHYSSLSAAEDELDNTDLDSAGDNYVFLLHDYTDTTKVFFDSSWTTSADDNIRITAASNDGHSGSWDSNKFNMSVNNDYFVIATDVPHMEIDHLQLANTNGSYNNRDIFRDQADGGTVYFHDNLMKTTWSSSKKAYSACIQVSNASSNTSYYWNNACDESWYAVWIESGNTEGAFYNNTFVEVTVGVAGYYQNIDWYNNIVQDCSNSMGTSGRYPSGADYNIDDCTYRKGFNGTNDQTSVTMVFDDKTNFDLHLDSTYDTEAIDCGDDTTGCNNPGSGLFSDDVDGTTRGAKWDIGFDEE